MKRSVSVISTEDESSDEEHEGCQRIFHKHRKQDTLFEELNGDQTTDTISVENVSECDKDSFKTVPKKLLDIKNMFLQLEERVSNLCEENRKLLCPIHKIQTQDNELPDNFDDLVQLANAFGGLKFMFYQQILNRRAIKPESMDQPAEEEFEEEPDMSLKNSPLYETMMEKMKSFEKDLHMLAVENAKLKTPIPILRRITSITDTDLGKLSKEQLREFYETIDQVKAKIDKKMMDMVPDQ